MARCRNWDAVQPGDVVAVDGEPVAGNDQERIVIAYHKPVGIVCTTDQRREKDNIIDAINFPTRIYPVGRLDKMSEGLIFLTNDGDIVNDILRARYGHEKEYHVTVNQPITGDFVERMSSGVAILDTVTLPCEVEQTGRQSFKIVLKQGLNRQIRRMCEELGYRVRRLKRTRIMHVELGDLPVGKYRSLDDQELRNCASAPRGPKKLDPLRLASFRFVGHQLVADQGDHKADAQALQQVDEHNRQDRDGERDEVLHAALVDALERGGLRQLVAHDEQDGRQPRGGCRSAAWGPGGRTPSAMRRAGWRSFWWRCRFGCWPRSAQSPG